jgi:hypothetical protein
VCTFSTYPAKVWIEGMLTELEEENFDETVIGLYSLSELVLSLIMDGGRGREQTITLIKAYSATSDSLELLANYDQAASDENTDLAHEFGMAYSESIADLQDHLDELKNDGIIIRLQ